MYPRTPTRAHNPYTNNAIRLDGVIFYPFYIDPLVIGIIIWDLRASLLYKEALSINKYKII